MSDLPLLLAALLLFSRAPSRSRSGGAVVSSEAKNLVLAEFSQRGWPTREADAVIRLESGWNPRAMNPTSSAVGLIQFMPKTLERVGWTGGPHAFALLDAAEQAPFVGKFLSGIGKRWRVPGDTYLAIFAPAFVGAPDDEVIFAEYSKAWAQNPALRDGPTGPITAGSVRGILLRRLSRT